jgi:hypothetical protein
MVLKPAHVNVAYEAASTVALAWVANRSAAMITNKVNIFGSFLSRPHTGRARLRPIAVEPQTTLLQNRPVRGEGGFGCACRISGTGLPIPACLREEIFFLGRAGIEGVAP